jgi:hypothetical protein
MTPLKEYVEKNNTNDVAVQSYIFNRCAAVSLYVGSLSQHNKDQTVTTQSLKNYELFAEANMAHLVSKGNMTAQDARKNFEDNVPPMSKAYAKDGQENFVKTFTQIDVGPGAYYVNKDFNRSINNPTIPREKY